MRAGSVGAAPVAVPPGPIRPIAHAAAAAGLPCEEPQSTAAGVRRRAATPRKPRHDTRARTDPPPHLGRTSPVAPVALRRRTGRPAAVSALLGVLLLSGAVVGGVSAIAVADTGSSPRAAATATSTPTSSSTCPEEAEAVNRAQAEYDTAQARYERAQERVVRAKARLKAADTAKEKKAARANLEQARKNREQSEVQVGQKEKALEQRQKELRRCEEQNPPSPTASPTTSPTATPTDDPGLCLPELGLPLPPICLPL